MESRIRCPTCGTRLTAPAEEAVSRIHCPMCASVIVVAVPARPRPSREESEQEDDRYPRSRHSRRKTTIDDEDEDEERSIRWSEENKPDPAGTVGVMLGSLAILLLMMTCFTWGISYCLCIPTAIFGLIVSVFARTQLRVIGITLNVISLLPAVVLLAISLLFAAAAGPGK